MCKLKNRQEKTTEILIKDYLARHSPSVKQMEMHGQLTSQRMDANCGHRYYSEQHIGTCETCPNDQYWRYDLELYCDSIPQYETSRRTLLNTNILMVVGFSMQTNTAELLQNKVNDLSPIYFINPRSSHNSEACLVSQATNYQGTCLALNDFTVVTGVASSLHHDNEKFEAKLRAKM